MNSGPFSLSRWFQTIGLLAILGLVVICAFLQTRLFANRMLLQEGRVTMQFVQSIVDVEDGSSYFEGVSADQSRYMEDLLAHIAAFPDVLRANLYSRDKRILWSSDKALIGRSFAHATNDELDEALSGSLEVHTEDAEEAEATKPEHENLRADDAYFIELYVPVRDLDRKNVVGAVEIYRAPRMLRNTVAAGTRIIWAGAIGAGMVLFLVLLPLVRRAENLIRIQHERLVESETRAAVGDLGAAVAHGIRNPLAVIRTSAELVRDGTRDSTAREAAAEIMTQVDRLEHWVRELLTYVHVPAGREDAVPLEPLIRENLVYFATEMQRRGIHANVDFAANLPPVRGDAVLLAQVINSVVANAVEAMPDGGEVTLQCQSVSPAKILLQISDTGQGMTDVQLTRAFRPFQTSKSHGLGVGLPLAKRIVERMGGTISLSSKPGSGTSVSFTLPTASPA